MHSALIGHTGFVGGNLLNQTSFDALFNSKNIESICGQEFDVIVCCGAPAVKWLANKEPDRDRKNLDRLTDCLGQAQAKHCVLVSTVDVYPNPVGVNEDSSIDAHAATPYGRHRMMLELFVRKNFDATIVRLPGLFGKGLKKNVIYDFANDNALEMICPDSVFQFYNLDRLWSDLEVVRRHQLPLVNFATEGVSVRSLAREAFGRDFENPQATQAARYDFHTKYDHIFGGDSGYMLRRDQVMAEMVAFVNSLREEPTE